MRRRVGSLVGAALLLGATVLAAAVPAAAHDRDGRANVIKSGLSSPKGIGLLTRNSIVVGQGAYAPPAAPAFEYAFRGPHKGTFTDLTDPLNIVDLAVTPDGAGWAIGNDHKLYRQGTDGVIKVILDIAAYQKADPDPYNNPVEDPAETNPFGLAALKSNDVLLADAAGNDIIRVKADGTAWTVARFPRRLVKTDKVGDASLPPKLPAEAVPTSIAIGPDGWAYVGQLVGFRVGRVRRTSGGSTPTRRMLSASPATRTAPAEHGRLASRRSWISRSTRGTGRCTSTSSRGRGSSPSRLASSPAARSRPRSCCRSRVTASDANWSAASYRKRAASWSAAEARSS